MARRPVVVGALIVVLASSTIAVLRYFGVAFPTHGPLGWLGAGAEIGVTEEAGRTFATPFFGGTNATDEPLRIESVELLGRSRGLEVLGMGTCDRGSPRCLMATSYRHWPPLALDLQPVDGFELPPGGGFAVIVGWRADRPGTYHAGGIELTYRQGSRRFVTEVGPSVVVHVTPSVRDG